MKAIVYQEYGSPDDVLELQDIDKPIVVEDEVLVRIRPDLEAAEEFVRRRLEIYERMWDGCGCKVNYDDP